MNLKGSFKCECAEGYIDPHGDGTICEVAGSGEDAVVLFAYDSEIRQLRENVTNYVYSGLIEDEDFVLAIDIDPIQRCQIIKYFQYFRFNTLNVF